MWREILGGWVGGILNPNIDPDVEILKDTTAEKTDYTGVIIAVLAVVVAASTVYFVTRK